MRKAYQIALHCMACGVYWGIRLLAFLTGKQRLLRWIQKSDKVMWVHPLIRKLLRKHRDYLGQNLANAFPDQPEQFYTRVTHDVYRNMLTTGIESATLSDTAFQHTQFTGLEAVRKLAATNRIMFVSCHINNWEICRTNLLKLDFPIVSFYRDYSQQLFNHRRYNHKNRFGPSIPTHQTSRYIQALEDGQHGFMMMDIKVKKGRNGKKLPFCQLPAWTSLFAADMASQHNMVIVPVHLERHPDVPDHYQQIFGDPILATGTDTGTSQATLNQTTTAINDYFSAVITRNPGSWLLWDTNRWGP
jgi:lauroyl/myristoyl acyltransferase